MGIGIYDSKKDATKTANRLRSKSKRFQNIGVKKLKSGKFSVFLK